MSVGVCTENGGMLTRVVLENMAAVCLAVHELLYVCEA